MEELSLRVFPDPILSTVMPELEDIHEGLSVYTDQMFKIMYSRNGIGLAANQAGWKARVIVMNLSGDPHKKDEEMILINPQIISTSKETFIEEEGCLSFPDVKANVQRKENLVVKALDLSGREMVYHAEDLFSRCVQHEMDHLNGITFIERMTPDQKALVADQIKALKEAYTNSSV